MPDQVDEPGHNPETPGEGGEPGSDKDGARPSPAPFKHTWWQRLIRDLYKLYGPAQTGVPPYATPEEREAWRLANLPQTAEAKRTSTAPPGYRMVEYKDGQGYVHRSLVPDSEPPVADRPPEPPQPNGPSGASQQD
jgi:hypothetical protein